MKTILASRIEAHPFFHGLTQEQLEMVCAGATERCLLAEEILFRPNEPASQFYLIQNGRIRLEAVRPTLPPLRIQTLGAGDVLGWSWLFPPFLWHFRARALEPCGL